MTEYLLDTNVVIDSLNGNANVRHRVAITPYDSRLVSSISCFELWYGVAKSGRPERNAQRLLEALQDFRMIDLDHEDAREAGAIRARFRRAKLEIGHYDTLIAGQALARGLTLVTANEREFRRVDGLRLVNWRNP